MKERVHNELEANVLIKEAFSNGNEDKYNNCKFFTHGGEFLFTCKIDTVGYELDYSSDGIVRHSTIVEL